MSPTCICFYLMAKNVIWKLGTNIIITLLKQFTEYVFLRHFFVACNLKQEKIMNMNNNEEYEEWRIMNSNNLENTNV